jgi:predicted PurR-regulated permease PerM
MSASRPISSNPTWISLPTLYLIVAILITATSVLVPIALGVILAFALNPVVRFFGRLRLPHVIGVALCMAMLFSMVGGLGYVLGSQVAELSDQATRYSSSIRQKVRELQKQRSVSLGGLTKTVDKITE